MPARRVFLLLAFSAFAAFFALLPPRAVCAQTFPASSYRALQWRLIGPFRAGRTVAVSGAPAQPGVFYMAPTDGGVWKTTDYGRTWDPIFAGQDTGSIGALAVAPSDQNVIYAASGEGLRRPDLSVGDGIYKSVDAGKTWSHLGLRDGEQINGLAVDPRDSNRLFAAVLGHPYGPNEQRGLYRSLDGGRTWQKVLGRGPDVGAATVVIDPKDPSTVYASLWASRNPPWRLLDEMQLWNAGGLYKSTDGGTNWTQLKGGLPSAVGRIGLDVSRADTNRVYAWVNTPDGCGIYRSNDAGTSWKKVDGEERVCGRGDDFSGIAADPADPNVVYAANTTMYRSTDGGTTWTGIKGAPGGDDYHTIWIDPDNRRIILLGVDQGATLSVNGGRTWSSWYNQPTAQFYHVITDNRFPYRVFGGQQESGSAEVLSRSDDGEIWMRDWHPIGAEEYGYIAPDPLHPHTIYGAGGPGGHVTRYNERTHQTQDVSPVFDRTYRFERTVPLVFNRVDKRTLYVGANVIFATQNGGTSWRAISPDLTRKNPGLPATFGAFKGTSMARLQRGVVFSLAPSYVDGHLLWAGTSDGLVWRTNDDGRHWIDVTPPHMTAWTRIMQIDASHFDRSTAYVAASRFHLDDLHPYIYRTHDGGKTWQLIVNGLPPNAPVNTVREDPKRRGLLFAGTERTVYVSFDDGGHWQSLQRNLPSTSIRDLVIHDDDVVVGTHGRSFWILDDIASLRQFAAADFTAPAFLFKPATAYRIRRDTWTDTPLPPEEPAGKNPPDGAILDYHLATAARGPVILTIRDAAGRLVRRWSSTDVPPPIDPEITVPTYWVKPPQRLGAGAGMHRFIWDYRYADPRAVHHDYPISAIVHDTPRGPQGVLAMPGVYAATLEVDGHRYTQRFTLRMDPRATVSHAGLQAQFQLAGRAVALMNQTYAEMDKARRAGDEKRAEAFARYNDELSAMLDVMEGADAAPTTQAAAALARLAREVQHA